MATVTAFRNLQEVESLRLTWNALLCESDDVSWFQTLDWYKYSLESIRPDWKPLVLLVESADRNVGILPLAIATSQGTLGRIRELVVPPMPEGSLFRPIGRSVTATMITAARFLERHPLWWDVTRLQGIDRNGWDRGRTEDAFANAGLRLQANGVSQATRWQLDEEPELPAEKKWCFEPVDSSQTSEQVEWIHIRPEAARYGDGDPCWAQFDRYVRDVDWEDLQVHLPETAAVADPIQRLVQFHEFASERGTADLLIELREGQVAGFAYHACHNRFAVRVAEGRSRTVVHRVADGELEPARTIHDESTCRLSASGIRVLETFDDIRPGTAVNATTVHRLNYRGYAKASSRVRLLRMLHWLRPNEAV